jgi:DNA-binding LacI/PurR family transcriptional regulator
VDDHALGHLAAQHTGETLHPQRPAGCVERAMCALLESFPAVDAVFVASDLMAAGALQALRAAGRSVPDDVAVAGFDDSAIAIATNPMLTTIRQPLAEIAEETVRLLLALLEEEDAEAVILPTELIVRDSAL